LPPFFSHENHIFTRTGNIDLTALLTYYMKTPRDLSAQELIKILGKYGYEVSRQKGSHIRLVRQTDNGAHYVTVPNHNPIKLGHYHQL
jgi:predicted RNA binding protein YcfA (HicA-like mRNA interferase family)